MCSWTRHGRISRIITRHRQNGKSARRHCRKVCGASAYLCHGDQRHATGINFAGNLPITTALRIHTIIAMAKDLVDFHTIDVFSSASVNITCGQVLMDRHRHIAIVAKKGRACAYLVQVKSGMLKLTRHATRDIATNWLESACQYESALDKLIEMGRRKGITDAARVALDRLRKNGKEPIQRALFS